jgi:hypothetical protein
MTEILSTRKIKMRTAPARDDFSTALWRGGHSARAGACSAASQADVAVADGLIC